MKRLFWLVIATLPIAIVAALSWFGVFTFVNGYLVRDLGWSNADWTFATLCLTVAMFFWYPVSTELASCIGRRYTVGLAMTAATLGFLGLAVTANPVVIYGLMMLMGATTAAYLVAWMPLVAEAGGNRPNRSMTLASFVLNTVAVLMLLIGGQWIGPGTYRIAVTTFGALSGLCVLAFFVTSRRLEHLLADESDPARPIVSDPRSTSILNLSRTEIMALARGPLPMVVLFGTCAAPFCFHTSNQLFPNLARDVHGFSEQAIATLVGLGRIPSLVTMLTMSFIIDRLNPIRAYGVGVLLDGIVIVVLALASRAGTLCAAYLLFYFVHGIVWGAGLPSVSACVRPERRAPPSPSDLWSRSSPSPWWV